VTRPAPLPLQYDVGSVHQHTSLGRVTVVAHSVIRAPGDAYCGPLAEYTPVIADATGRRWSCYCPHVDLIESHEGAE